VTRHDHRVLSEREKGVNESEFFEPSGAPVDGPLAGLRVVEATTTLAGPMCACVLADMGADVIKIELPGGEVMRRLPPFLPGTDPPLSFAHAHVNRNKRSLCLDLRSDAGRDVFLELAARSDVVVQNFRPGTMEEWGVGYEAVRAVKPDIVYVSISGYGQYGPEHDQCAYDPIAQGASGFMSLNGEADGSPVRAPIFLADDLAGLHGAIAVLGALHHRARTGEGQHLDVALLDSLLFQSDGFLTLGALGFNLPRLGNEYSIAAPASVFAAKDGHVFMGVLLDTHWAVLARILGRDDLAENPDYATIPGRLARRAEVNAVTAEWCANQTVAEITAVLRDAGLPVTPVRTYAEAASDPHIRARGMLQDVVHADGSTQPITGPAAKFSRTPTRVRTGAPALGAHTDEILGELGFDAERIASLRSAQII
jgi:formyl-CoA transferase